MPPYSLRRLVWAGPLATLAAILADLLYFAATRVLGQTYLLPVDGGATRFAAMPALAVVIVQPRAKASRKPRRPPL